MKEKHPITILIADDHSVVRLGLKTIFNLQPDMRVVGEAADGESAVRLAAEAKPAVAIVDLMMPGMDGAETTREIRRLSPGTRILILTSFGTSDDLRRAIANGASGALLKDTDNENLPVAVRRIVRGEEVFADELAVPSPSAPTSSGDPQLTDRQNEILGYVMRGFSNEEIAGFLGITKVCVKKHLTSAYERLGATNRAEAVAIALRKNLLKP